MPVKIWWGGGSSCTSRVVTTLGARRPPWPILSSGGPPSIPSRSSAACAASLRPSGSTRSSAAPAARGGIAAACRPTPSPGWSSPWPCSPTTPSPRRSAPPDPADSAFVKARRRLGVAPLRGLFREAASGLAPESLPGVRCRRWQLMGIGGTTFNLPDTPANERAFGRPSNQRSPAAYPQLRVLAHGSYLSKVYPSYAARKADRDGVVVRVIEY